MNQISTLHIANGIGHAQHVQMPVGLNVEQMARKTHGQIDDIVAYVRAAPDYHQEWIELDRKFWSWVKPKTNDAVMFGYRMHGGSRNTFAIVATVLVSVLLPGIGTALTPVLGAFGAALATAAIGVGATFAINALFPGQSAAQGASLPDERAKQFANVDSDSNVLAKFAFLPLVVGERRITPPEIASPRFYLDAGVQTINRIFALDDHHEISDIQVDRAPVSDFESIEYEIKDGAESSGVDTFVDQISRIASIGETLSTFSLDGVDLVDQANPQNSEPRWSRFVTAYHQSLEEISLRLQLDSFIKSDSATQKIRVPLRIRFREKGSTGAWNNLPEIHLVGRDVSTSLKEIRIRWDNQFGEADTSGDIFYQFYQNVPPAEYVLSDNSSGDQWQAHEYFKSGEALTDVQNISGKRNGIRIPLDPDVFPKMEYEWEFIRGIACKDSDLGIVDYNLGGAVNSLFVARSSSAKWQVPVDQGSYVGRVTAAHVSSIAAETPCQRPRTALIALKSRGQNVKNVTALAASVVRDWDGEGWNTLTTTKNPATHYVNRLVAYLQYNGISTELINNQQMVDWRQECIDQGYEVSAVFAGASNAQVLSSIATAGFARPRFSDGYGIDWFRDRSQERPAQTFSPRNCGSLSVEWVSGERPTGIRAKFNNERLDYRSDELQVNNPLYSNFGGYEARDYPMIANPDLIERRAYFDMLQAHYQGRRMWVVDAPIEGMVCERGDLIGIVSDLLNDNNSGARISRVLDATNFTIDQDIPVEDTSDLYQSHNIFDEDNLFSVGFQSVCLVSTPTGTEMANIVAAERNADGNVIRVDKAFSSTDLAGAHIAIGPIDDFMNRCFVSEVRRREGEDAQLICVDEAPEIHTKIMERYG